MGTSYNPKIITNNLVLNIDPANYKSYPSSQDPYVNSVGSSSNDKWWLAYDATAAGLRFGRHFTPIYASCAWNPTSGQWYHVAAVRSSNLMYFYINGLSQSVTNQSSMSGISFSQNGLSIGGMSTPYYLNGNIAAFRMYNRGLNSTEVYNNYVSDRDRFGV